MRSRAQRATVWTVTLLVGVASAAGAQTLADVARRARIDSMASGSRTFTNADLPDVDPLVPAFALDPIGEGEVQPDSGPAAVGAAETALEVTAEDTPPLLEAPVKAREKRPESYWRARASDVRERLARATANVNSVAGRLDVLERGPVSQVTEQERKLAAEALAKHLANLGYIRVELDRLEDRARAEGVPLSWIN